MTEIINKKTGERYLSKVDIEKKNWLRMMYKENAEFFDKNDLGDLFFLPV